MRFPRSTLTRFHIFLNKIANFLMSYLPFFLPSHLLFCPRHLAHQSQSSLNAQFLGAKHELKPERKKKKKKNQAQRLITFSHAKKYTCVCLCTSSITACMFPSDTSRIECRRMCVARVRVCVLCTCAFRQVRKSDIKKKRRSLGSLTSLVSPLTLSLCRQDQREPNAGRKSPEAFFCNLPLHSMATATLLACALK